MQDGLCSFLFHSGFAPDSEGSGLRRAEQRQSLQPSSLQGWESLRLPFGKEIERKVEKEEAEGQGGMAALETFPKLELSEVAFSPIYPPHPSLLKTNPEQRVSKTVGCG